MPRRPTSKQEVRLVRTYLLVNHRFQKLLRALDNLAGMKLLDRERMKENRLAIRHLRARIGLDAAEAIQDLELSDCNRLDRKLRRIRD